MKIRYDKSYINAFDRKLVEHGYGFEDLHSIRFRFEYTEDEKQSNREFANSHSSDEWSSYCDKMAQIRSDEMQPIMEALGDKFICHQFRPDCGEEFRSDKWELFFWCNDFHTTTSGRLSGRDYSYFTLTFNDRMTPGQRKDVCSRVLTFLKDRFVSNDHLYVAVQYEVGLEEQKIADRLEELIPALVGKKCTYGGMDGKIVQAESGLFFVKKYARNRGYKLVDVDLLQLGWKLGM